MMVVFKMRDSVPSPRYSAICNVLRQWKTSLIPTYRVYRLYDIRRILHSSIVQQGARHVLPIIQFPVLTTPYFKFHRSAYQNNPRGMIYTLV